MVMPVTWPWALMVAVAEAPVPPPPEKVTVGAVVYPDPGTRAKVHLASSPLAFSVLVAVAGGVVLVMFRLPLLRIRYHQRSALRPRKVLVHRPD